MFGKLALETCQLLEHSRFSVPQLVMSCLFSLSADVRIIRRDNFSQLKFS